MVSIVSIQTDQSRPVEETHNFPERREVSIVSIQTDQSRQVWYKELEKILVKFQSYQSKQINPDICSFFKLE